MRYWSELPVGFHVSLVVSQVAASPMLMLP